MGYLFIIPSLILIFALILYPVFNTLYLSFFNYRVQTMALGKTFVGLRNFIKIFNDETFFKSLKFTLLFTVVAVSMETIIGMIFANIMNRKLPGQGIIRTSVLIPWAIPTIISGLMWKFMYSQQYGIINHIFLKLQFIKEAIPWLSDSFVAVIAVIIADVWKTTPYMSLLILSGLQTIPIQLYEAAAIDGANRKDIFLKITLPLIKPVLSVAILFRVLATFRIYDLIAVLTSGGPANATQSLSLYTIKTYFDFGNIGYGAALATVTFIISLLISLLFLDSLKSKLE
ncbi:carbohydrate ABC transporter membrane protein 1 (CUT1 family) [Halanaerobium saccharolyticum]|uniref:Carbohydrate ABC transporter membrane protein 1 (CUT1 family) n=2 Tax=Halanaerobium saccharolyticum TaxID=43595 RepID=A0A4R6M1G3_9FIRM|nr:carbohydrate ABC transporter membrane protein 1 (CUT1 family) [Halanaerobium saccharolyticum]